MASLEKTEKICFSIDYTGPLDDPISRYIREDGTLPLHHMDIKEYEDRLFNIPPSVSEVSTQIPSSEGGDIYLTITCWKHLKATVTAPPMLTLAPIQKKLFEVLHLRAEYSALLLRGKPIHPGELLGNLGGNDVNLVLGFLTKADGDVLDRFISPTVVVDSDQWTTRSDESKKQEEKSVELDLQDRLRKLAALDPLEYPMLFKLLIKIFMTHLEHPKVEKFKQIRFSNPTLKKYVFKYDFIKDLLIHSGYKEDPEGKGMRFQGDRYTLVTVFQEVQHLWKCAAKKMKDQYAVGASAIVNPDRSLLKIPLLNTQRTDMKVIEKAGKVGQIEHLEDGYARLKFLDISIEIPQAFLIPVKLLEPRLRGVSLNCLFEMYMKDRAGNPKENLKPVKEWYQKDIKPHLLWGSPCSFAEYAASRQNRPFSGQVDYLVIYSSAEKMTVATLLNSIRRAIGDMKDAYIFLDVVSLPPSLVNFPPLTTPALGKQCREVITASTKGVILLINSVDSPEVTLDEMSLIQMSYAITAERDVTVVFSKSARDRLSKVLNEGNVDQAKKLKIGRSPKMMKLKSVFSSAKAINQGSTFAPKTLKRFIATLLPLAIVRGMKGIRETVGRHHPHFLLALSYGGTALLARDGAFAGRICRRKIGCDMLEEAYILSHYALGPLHGVTIKIWEMFLRHTGQQEEGCVGPIRSLAQAIIKKRKGKDIGDVALIWHFQMAVFYNLRSGTYNNEMNIQERHSSMETAEHHWSIAFSKEIVRQENFYENKLLMRIFREYTNLLLERDLFEDVVKVSEILLEQTKRNGRPLKRPEQLELVAKVLSRSTKLRKAIELYQIANHIYEEREDWLGWVRTSYQSAMCWKDLDQALAIGFLSSLRDSPHLKTVSNVGIDFEYNTNYEFATLLNECWTLLGYTSKEKDEQKIKAYETCIECTSAWLIHGVLEPRFKYLFHLGSQLHMERHYPLAEKVFQRLKGIRGIKKRTTGPTIDTDKVQGANHYNLIAKKLADCLEKQGKFSEAHSYREELMNQAKELCGNTLVTAQYLYALGFNKAQRIAKETRSGQQSAELPVMKLDAEQLFSDAIMILRYISDTSSKLAADVTWQLAWARTQWISNVDFEELLKLAREALQLQLKYTDIFQVKRYKARQLFVAVVIKHARSPVRETLLKVDCIEVLNEWLHEAQDMPQLQPPREDRNIRWEMEYEGRMLMAKVFQELGELSKAVELLENVHKRQTNRCVIKNLICKDDRKYCNSLEELENVLSTCTEPKLMDRYEAIRQKRAELTHYYLPLKDGFDFTAEQTQNTEKFPDDITIHVRLDGHRTKSLKVNPKIPLSEYLNNVKTAMLTGAWKEDKQVPPDRVKELFENLILVKSKDGNELPFSRTFEELGINAEDLLIARTRRASEVESSPNKGFDYSNIPSSSQRSPLKRNQRNLRVQIPPRNTKPEQFIVGQTVRVISENSSGEIKRIVESQPQYQVFVHNIMETRWYTASNLKPDELADTGNVGDSDCTPLSRGPDLPQGPLQRIEEVNGESDEMLETDYLDAKFLRHVLERSKNEQ